MTSRYFQRLLFIVLLLNFTLKAASEKDLEQSLRKFVTVFNIIDQNIAVSFNPVKAIYRGALPSMVRTLDPYSAFLDTDQFNSLQEMQRSTEKGFGSILNLLPGRAIVLQTLPGSPSERFGLLSGDEIIAVNDYDLAYLQVEQIASLLGQARQNQVKLIVKRPSHPKLLRIKLTPAELADPSVTRAFLLEDGIGHIKVSNFERHTAEELRDAIEKLGGQKLDGLILDLRGNPGGVIEAAIKTAAIFLDERQTILWIQARNEPQEELRVPNGNKSYNLLLSVLVDSKTASAAELVAAALQDHDRATLIGQHSYGKGVIQSVFSLSENTALALTTAQYLTPKKKKIQRPIGRCGSFLLATCLESNSGDAETPTERGGVTPNHLILPRGYAKLEAVIEQSNSFFEFAQDYTKEQQSIPENFVVSNKLLDDFQLFLSKRHIRAPLVEWSMALTFIRSRLKQEIFNLAFGVAKGDQVETIRDRQVMMALRQIKNAIQSK